MKFSRFEHELLPRILIPLLGGLFVFGAVNSASRAEPVAPRATTNYIVSAADGYGMNDCIKSGAECAQVVADAWCSAHGHGAARKFGPAGDVTGAIKVSAPTAPAKAVDENDVFIACGQ